MAILSILTPTFQSSGFLDRAVASVLAQSSPHWELVIAPDDDGHYSRYLALDERIKVVGGNEHYQTGPGPARTRALAGATGDFVACLDDDDQLAPTFVAEVLKSLEHHSVVTTPTAYIAETGETIREIGKNLQELSIDQFAVLFGSMHSITSRATSRGWDHVFAEDVLHTCQAIDAAGGRISVVENTSYLLTVRQSSVCSTNLNIGAEYERLARSTFDGEMSARGAEMTRQL